MNDTSYQTKIQLMKLFQRKDHDLEMMVRIRRDADLLRRLGSGDAGGVSGEGPGKSVCVSESGDSEADLEMQIRILAEDCFRVDQEIRDLVSQLSLPDFMGVVMTKQVPSSER